MRVAILAGMHRPVRSYHPPLFLCHVKDTYLILSGLAFRGRPPILALGDERVPFSKRNTPQSSANTHALNHFKENNPVPMLEQRLCG